jgi:hypothetical protein
MKGDKLILVKAKRILVLAVIIAGIGLFFSVQEILEKFNSNSATVFGENQKSYSKLEQVANYPEPAKFQQINYDGVELTEQNSVFFESNCSDKYITILVFPRDTDYRQDPSRAVINKAFECPWQKKFSYEFSFADLKNLPHGRYYGFLADQGEVGLWYNPR